MAPNATADARQRVSLERVDVCQGSTRRPSGRAPAGPTPTGAAPGTSTVCRGIMREVIWDEEIDRHMLTVPWKKTKHAEEWHHKPG